MSEANELPQKAPRSRCRVMIGTAMTLLVGVMGVVIWGVYGAHHAQRASEAALDQVALMNKRMDKIENSMTFMMQKMHQLIQSPVSASDALSPLLKAIQEMPELQLQLADLDEAIRMGRPFIALYRPLAPFLDISPQDAPTWARFRALGQQGVPSYDQLRSRFRAVGDALLKAPAGTGFWYEKLWAGVKGALALRPLPAIIEHPRTAADYVRTLEALLELQDTDRILEVLNQAPASPALTQWAQDFQDYYFVHRMQRRIMRDVMRNALKGNQG